jgi:hypothetical protein
MSTRAACHQDLALLVAGFLVWATAFAALYGLHALGCDFAWHRIAIGPASLLRIFLVLLWVGALIAAGALAASSLRRAVGQSGTLSRAAAASAVAAVFAIIWTGSPVALLGLCR